MKIRAYEQDGPKLSCFDLNNRLPALKEEHPWLKEVNSQCQIANKNLDNAFTRFFREKKGFPLFKSKKKSGTSFQVPQHYAVNFGRTSDQTPEDRRDQNHLPQDVLREDEIGNRIGHFDRDMVCLDSRRRREPRARARAVLIQNYARYRCRSDRLRYTLSTGEEVGDPRNLRKSLGRLKCLQRRLSRKKKGSKNRQKAIRKLARCHEKVAEKRFPAQPLFPSCEREPSNRSRIVERLRNAEES